MKPEYSLSLALVDFLPVIFTAIGLSYIARMVNHVDSKQGKAAWLGIVLVVTGGLFKAIWKTIMAGTANAVDVTFLDKGLFAFMAPGYTLLMWSVWQSVRKLNNRSVYHAWAVPGIFIVLMFAYSFYLGQTQPGTPAWSRVLLTVLVIMTVITGLALIYFGYRQKMPLVGALFIVNLVGVMLLNGLARLPEQTLVLQWIEEGINTVSWLSFAFAAYKIYQHVRERYRVGSGSYKGAMVQI
jgi:hypothetical protein